MYFPVILLYNLAFEIELKIEKSDPVILLSQYVEEMDLTDLYSTYERIRENQATPRQLLKILLYGYMNREYSSRAIETRCKRDINFMYLLEDKPAPNHATKKDYAMLNGQLKPAYNLQHGVDSEYIVRLTIGPQHSIKRFLW